MQHHFCRIFIPQLIFFRWRFGAIGQRGYIIKGEVALVNEDGEEQPLKAGIFALVLLNKKHQYRNKSMDQSLVLICGVPKEFE